jgi:hypothetical protein
MRRTNFGYWLLLVAAMAAVGMIAYLKWLKNPVLPGQEGTPAGMDISALVRVHADQANRRDRNALSAFEMDADRILSEHRRKLAQVADLAAKKASAYASCCKLVGCLAWDKVRGRNTSEACLEGKLEPFVEPAVRDMSREMEAAVARLERDLCASNVRMAGDLAAVAPKDYGRDLVAEVGTSGRADARTALCNLGLDATGVGISLGFDAFALCKSQVARGLWRRMAAIAARMFARGAATTAASLTVAAADGPLPIGDVLAVGGMAWTAYDIHASRKRFRKEMAMSLRDLVGETANDVHGQAVAQAAAMTKRYQEFQDAMGSRTLGRTTRRRN